MNSVKQWILMEPMDSLFFRGSEPMIAGESHEVRSVFPPMPPTLIGALCTAILSQRGIDPREFTHPKNRSPTVSESYPFLGTPGSPRFQLVGPLFRLIMADGSHDWFFPVPATWFGLIPEQDEERPEGSEMHVATAGEFPGEAAALGLCGSVSAPLWVTEPHQDLESLNGYWCNAAAFIAVSHGAATIHFFSSSGEIPAGDPAVIASNKLFESEMRVGIALQPRTRRAVTGHLYSASHVRLRKGVSMAVGVSEVLAPGHLNQAGLLQLGGEQRVVVYQLLVDVPELNLGTSPWVMALSPFLYDDLKRYGWGNCARASGALIRIGGWDMQKRFHKPMTAWLPAGTVVNVSQQSSVPFGFVRL